LAEAIPRYVKHIQLARMVQGFRRGDVNSTKVLRHSKQVPGRPAAIPSGWNPKKNDRFFVYVGPPLASSVEES
jgi:hypothetical protein